MSLLSVFRRQKTPANHDRLGVYPTEVDLPSLADRRNLWTARAFAIGFVVSSLANVALAVGIASILPLYRVQPVLIGFNEKTDQVVTLQPLEIQAKSIDAMTEKLVRQYVVLRHSVVKDDTEMTRRWGDDSPIKLMTGQDAFAQFVQETRPAYAKLAEEQFTRSIEILSVSKLSTNFWQAEFNTTDHSLLAGLDASQDLRQRWVASMRVQYETQRITYDKRLINPLGFTVLQYSVAEKR